MAVIFHMPCLPPDEFGAAGHRQAIEDVWLRVHELLDELINDPGKRSYPPLDARVKQELDKFSLQRIGR